MPYVRSVNVGGPQEVTWLGRPVVTGIFKRPVEGRVRVRRHNLEGDGQADLEKHGGEYKAVYAYAREDLDFWAGELGRDLSDSAMGENLTTVGLDVTGAVIGERWRIGSALLEVVQPRRPCFKLGLRLGDPDFPQRFGPAVRPGAYLRVLEEGELGAGDEIVVEHRPAHGVTVGLVAYAYFHDKSLAPRVLAAPELAPGARQTWERFRRHAG
ncbi:hypothetical protein C3Y87_00355 [Carbonactinospora thermoautotrophica]|uniref:MOSC domain-containing protein n=1 Tax=Carbonactinospora thermoautotrophica TaxID=1469144 RepID=UPI0022701135|nr:MOSC domain-containing protein [Carbonactinospora thermoautotrophica]MCX9189895.1 hypothetical protein [Carbonactinospora thermoautotrophica]